MDKNRDADGGGQNPFPSWPRAVLHVDMDAFYVNVHIMDHPEDAGRPLVVGGKPNERGVVASASYEARQVGIRSAMPTSSAARLCPNLKIVPANWERIRECSHQVMEILAEYGPLEQISVDEAYIDLSEWPDPETAAVRIWAEVRDRSQLPCSVGLATSKLVAKVASDHDKPEGCTLIPPGGEAEFMAPLPTRVIWGIGPRTAEQLVSLNINTCGQLAEAEIESLRAVFGSQAESLKRRARGIDSREVQTVRGMARSISQEWTFQHDVADPELLKARMEKMSFRLARSLQKRNLIAHTIRVKFRWDDFTTFTRQRTIEVGSDDAQVIFQHALAIWEENWPQGKRMRLIGVGVSKLEKPASRQLEFDF